jgi:twitching motility two-component system response regulator PilH
MRHSVLVVEDHDDNRRLLELLLERNFEVTLASSAAEALALAEVIQIDLFVFDIHLGPTSSGVDLLQTLRANPRFQATPALACTAFVEPKDKGELFAAGFDAYLSKPFSPKELLGVLDALAEEIHAPPA